MLRLVRQVRRTTSQLSSSQRKGIDVLGAASIVMLAGVSVTGIWQFFAHTSDPYLLEFPEVDGDRVTFTTGAGLHDLFATGSGILALVGTAWFAYQVSRNVPWVGVAAITLTWIAALIGSLVRFNLIKIEGKSFADAGTGYPQIFTDNVDFVITDSGEISGGVFQLLVVLHVLTVPVLVGFAWWSIRGAIQRWSLEPNPVRTWFADTEL